MSNLVVKEISGIEFYVSADGKESGVSVTGLARLCGVSHQTISKHVIKPLAEPATKMPSETLEALRSKGFSPQLKGKVLLISAEFAAAVIAYYAFESRNQTTEAKFSLQKFALLGMDGWIKKVTGYNEASELPIQETINQLIKAVKVLSHKVEKLDNFYVATVELPGLTQQFSEYAQEPKETLDSSYFTLNAWLASKGYDFTRGQKCSLGRMMADLYKVNRQEAPKKIPAYKVGSSGGTLRTVYRASDEPMLNAALSKVLK